ncbi:MAG: inositol monophosphatase family protein [Candidatus Sericytochromatia bacterium]
MNKPDAPDLIALRELAVRLAQAGAAELLHYFGQLEAIRSKSTLGDWVTEADEASERAILELLRQEVPDHGVLAEESGRHSQDSPYLWVIDPLDGTVNYAHQLPFYCVSVGLLYAGEPVVGVILAPRLDECFVAAKGLGASLNGRPIRVSEAPNLERSLLATGFPYRKNETPDNNVAEFLHLLTRCQDIRRPGAAALDLAYVACGRFAGFWESHLNAWDVVAGAVLVSEAGGSVSAYSGGPLDPLSGEIVSSNGHVHEALVGAIQTARQQAGLL